MSQRITFNGNGNGGGGRKRKSTEEILEQMSDLLAKIADIVETHGKTFDAILDRIEAIEKDLDGGHAGEGGGS